jgi:hypothetical protein
VLDLRVYRAAFLPALVALFIAAFSLGDRPAPESSNLASSNFNAGRAFGASEPPATNSLTELARRYPDRPAGGRADSEIADRVAEELGARLRDTRRPNAGRPAFEVDRRLIDGQTAEGAGRLETVVGVRPGLSSRRVVVLAHRDGRGAASLSGTAALLELARVFRARDMQRTLVLVSTSGATTGFDGAREWARSAGGGPIDAVIVLGDLAGERVDKPWVVPWLAGSGPTPLALQRTAENAVRSEVGPNPGGAHASGQWLRRAFGLTVSEQGVIGDAGLPAVLLGVSGEAGPAPDERVLLGRMDAFGRAALRTVSAVDGSDPEREASPAGIVTMRNVLPDWAVRLLVGTLLLPALLTALDGFFRARRRHLPVGAWLRWTAAAAMPFAAAWAWARLLDLTGLLSAPGTPVMPDVVPFDREAGIAAASVALVLLVCWFGARPLLAGRARVLGNPAAGAAAAACGLVLCGATTLVWFFNPYAAALLLPAAHLWLFAMAPGSRWHERLGAVAVAVGLLPFLLAAIHYARALGLDPLELAWLALLATAGGFVTLPAALVTAALAGCLAGVVAVLRARRRVAATAPADTLRTRGPATYAGPGSLGGTESALRR